MRVINKALIGGGIVALAILIGIYVLGLLISPGVEPLSFSIHNSDVGKHRVIVEIFDPSNNSTFKEPYEANPKETIYSPKITKEKGEYTFKVTLDDKIEETYKAEVGIGRSSVSIYLYDKKVSGSEDPIYIVQALV